MEFATDVSRRGVFKVGTAFVAAMAGLVTSRSALAGTCGTPCCEIVHCNQCQLIENCNGGWVCPPGFQDSWWTCTSGSRFCTCGECTPGGSCWSGPWASCSVALCN